MNKQINFDDIGCTYCGRKLKIENTVFAVQSEDDADDESLIVIMCQKCYKTKWLPEKKP